MAKKKVKTKSKAESAKPQEPVCRYIEIVNWKKAQPRMKGDKNPWMKLYTSLLEKDAFAELNDTSRMLIIALWLYAAWSGRHVFPADPKWLKRKIPLLNSTPNLKPLLEAVDGFGNPKPWIKYCKDRRAKKSRSKERKKESTKERKKEREKRENRKKEKEKRAETLTGFGKEKKKEKTLTGFSKEEQNTTDQSRSEQRTGTEDQKREPANPNESEAGGSESHIMPTAPRSVSNAGPQSLGSVLAERFPEHWHDPEAEAFGWEIVEALGMPRNPHNLRIRSEWGAFAKWWSRLKTVAPALMLCEIRKTAIAKARFVASPKAKSARNRSAVWTHIMDGELSSKGISLPPARAGPKQRHKG